MLAKALKVFLAVVLFISGWLISIKSSYRISLEGEKIYVMTDQRRPVTDYRQVTEVSNWNQASELKNILMWTHNHTEPFNFFKHGRDSFIEAGCKYDNCYITNDRKYLEEVVLWDAILFHAPEYTWKGNPWHHGVPSARSSKQRYIFACIESSSNYPITVHNWDNYFNWTMTYKIKSDIPWLYLNVRDKSGKVIGPADNIKWETNMSDISKEQRDSLKTKTKAIAWFVSNCKTLSKREGYANELQKYLNKYNHTLDIYGKCGKYKCPHQNKDTCWRYLKEDYYFYLSFENSFSEDYTTEKLLQAMQNDVVPIVWGGSDYSKFAPPKSYINARDHTPEELARLIYNFINDFEKYTEFHKWKNYYTYHSSYDKPDTNPHCKLCEALNIGVNNSEMRTNSEYNDFRKWWNY